MPIEATDVSSSGTTVTRNLAGPRGIDLNFVTRGGTTSTSFPLYDIHGNNIATLSRTGPGNFSVNDLRTYDAWGSLRLGTSQNSNGYCGNLGHFQDAESGLVYMRARYYEPLTGRFISEDLSKSGTNWLLYCGDDPVNYQDSTGQFRWNTALLGFVAGMIVTLLGNIAFDHEITLSAKDLVLGILGAIIGGTVVMGKLDKNTEFMNEKIDSFINSVGEGFESDVEALESVETEAATYTLAGMAVDAYAEESGEVWGEIVADEIEESD
jgi:RHS repeat-associated protein